MQEMGLSPLEIEGAEALAETAGSEGSTCVYTRVMEPV
jgi:hypothetical protein